MKAIDGPANGYDIKINFDNKNMLEHILIDDNNPVDLTKPINTSTRNNTHLYKLRVFRVSNKTYTRVYYVYVWNESNMNDEDLIELATSNLGYSLFDYYYHHRSIY